ncbi:MAG: arylsulfatase, partial [Rhodopirellula sp. JB044]
NLANDRCENHNLADVYPERVQAMVKQWTTMAKEVLHAEQKTYADVKQSTKPHRHGGWTKYKSQKPTG